MEGYFEGDRRRKTGLVYGKFGKKIGNERNFFLGGKFDCEGILIEKFPRLIRIGG